MPTIYGPLDIVKNELRNAAIQNLGSAPASPVKGQLYFDTTSNTLFWYDGTQWIAAKAAAGAIPAASVTTQAIGDAPVVGTGTNYAREDHKHGMPAFGAVTAQTSFGAASSNGVAATLPRSDHTHGTPVHDAAAHSALLGNVTAEQTFGAASNNGAATTLARSDHAHGNPVHDAAAHSTIPLSALAVPTADVNWGGFRITNLATPIVASDAVPRSYVDSAINGLSWKDTVRVASTTNVALSGTATAIDGVTLNVGDRVLLKNQTNGAENGIWWAQSAAWNRASDALDQAALLNAAVFVSEGTTQADTAWVMTTNAPISVGVTTLTWVQFGAPATYVGGAGLTLTGNTFDVGAGSGITVAADSVAVDTTVIATRAYVDSGSNVAHKYATTLAGSASPETITHNLNTRDVQVSVYNSATPYTAVQVDWAATTVNTITVTYNPNLGAGYRVVVVG